MKEKAPIIVGIDFSTASPFVLRQAVHIGSLTGSPVVAVHVLSASILHHWAGGDPQGTAHISLARQAESRLADLVQDEVADAGVLFEVCVGRPAEELSRIVRERNAALLIIAANDMTKKHLGSIASRCTRSVPTDVLIARDWQSGNFKKIIACTDFSASSGKLLEKSVAMAEANSAALEVVHVMYPPGKDYWGASIDDPGDGTLSYTERVRNKAQERMSRSLAPYAGRLESLEHTHVILESTAPSVALTYHIKGSGADLVVLGTRVHSKLASIFVGSNAEKLLHDAPVSVLAVRC